VCDFSLSVSCYNLTSALGSNICIAFISRSCCRSARVSCCVGSVSLQYLISSSSYRLMLRSVRTRIASGLQWLRIRHFMPLGMSFGRTARGILPLRFIIAHLRLRPTSLMTSSAARSPSCIAWTISEPASLCLLVTAPESVCTGEPVCAFCVGLCCRSGICGYISGEYPLLG
jgi:hypothetical protein